MKETTNLKLKKPELTDAPPDITALNQNWDVLDTKIKAIEDGNDAHLAENASLTTRGHVQLQSTIDTSETKALTPKALKNHQLDLTSHGEVLSLYRSGKDSNGVYVMLEWKRADGTLAKKSILSGGTSPKYTTRTVTYYDVAGTTVILTKTYTLAYTGDDLTSEVLQ